MKITAIALVLTFAACGLFVGQGSTSAQDSKPSASTSQTRGATEPTSSAATTSTRSSDSRPAVSFMGSGGNASHVVYVIDCSGSMIDTIDDVKEKLTASINNLDPSQDFHVIFFNVRAIELSDKKLIAATEENKNRVSNFIRFVRSEKDTDPIPALRRAFAVLLKADKKPGKIIYLLTDGDFPNNGIVISTLKELNQKKEVQVNTILWSAKEEKTAKGVLGTIAKDNVGKYVYVSSTQAATQP